MARAGVGSQESETRVKTELPGHGKAGAKAGTGLDQAITGAIAAVYEWSEQSLNWCWA